MLNCPAHAPKAMRRAPGLFHFCPPIGCFMYPVTYQGEQFATETSLGKCNATAKNSLNNGNFSELMISSNFCQTSKDSIIFNQATFHEKKKTYPPPPPRMPTPGTSYDTYASNATAIISNKTLTLDETIKWYNFSLHMVLFRQKYISAIFQQIS